jgi:hypothetical protein
VPGETHRTIIIAGSRQAAEQRCKELGINPRARTTIMAVPSNVHGLRGITLRETDVVEWGYTGHAPLGGIANVLRTLKIAGFV